jgi:4-hydroxy-4-methyl-2-oxoglutarate aldolase
MSTSDDDILRRFAGLDSSTLSDVLDVSGYTGQVLAADLRLLDRTTRIIGRAVTARGEVGVTSSGISPYEIESHIGPGEVAVIATGRFKVGAVNGGMITLQYMNRGAAGMVTDGAVRDANETIGYGFPVVCGTITPTNSAGRFSIVSIGEPVKLPGLDVDFVTVTPGDYILADGDGTVVVPQDIILAVIEATEQSVVIERTITREIKGGSTRESAFARHPRFAHIPKLRTQETA